MEKSLLLPRAKRHQSEALVRKELKELRVEAERSGVHMEEQPLSEDDLMSLKRNGIPQIIDDFRNTSQRTVNGLLRATMATRKLLSVDSSARDKEVEFTALAAQMIQLGLVGDLCVVLDSHSPRLQFEAVWGLTNAMFTNPEAVAQSGAIGKICNLLDSPSTPLREQCMWSLGNFMSTSAQNRNFVLQHDANLCNKLCTLLQIAHGMTDDKHQTLPQPADDDLKLPGVAQVPISRSNYLRQATWALSSVLRGGDTPTYAVDQLKSSSAMLCICDLVLHCELPNIVANALWLLADLADLHSESSRYVLRLGLLDRIIELGIHSYVPVQAAASQCMYNMASGDEYSLRSMLMLRRADLVLINHLESERRELWQNASWTMSYACSKLELLCKRLASSEERVLDLFLQIMCDTKRKSEVRQDAITVVAFCFNDPQVLLRSDHALLALLELVQPGSGVERDFALLGHALQLLLVLLQCGGRKFIAEFESRGGLSNLHRIESTLRDNVLADLLELVLGLFELEDDGEEEEEEEPSLRYLPEVRSSVVKNAESSRQGFQSYARE